MKEKLIFEYKKIKKNKNKKIWCYICCYKKVKKCKVTVVIGLGEEEEEEKIVSIVINREDEILIYAAFL